MNCPCSRRLAYSDIPRPSGRRISAGRRDVHETRKDRQHADRDAAPPESAMPDRSRHGAYPSHPWPTRPAHLMVAQSSAERCHHTPQRRQADLASNPDGRAVRQRDFNPAIGHSSIATRHHWRLRTPRPCGRPMAHCSGTNTACGSDLRTPRRTRLRQFHSGPRLISYRWAISALPAPGCSVSAPIRSFSAALQRRRRSPRS